MNILMREQRAGRKAFLFWMLGMFLLCFVGIIKYQSYSASGSMTELVASFPRIALAVMGVVGVDISTLTGYTVLLFYYVLICAVIYAVHLGASAVSRESVDRTYEFVFTKPCPRARVLGMKLVSAYGYLLLFCILNGGFSMLAAAYLNTTESAGAQIWLCTLSVFLIGALFVALSAFLAAAAKRPERGTLYGNLAFLYAFILGVVCNLLDHPGILRLIAPFNYFSAADLVAKRLDPLYAAVTLVLTAAFLYGAFREFQKKDLL